MQISMHSHWRCFAVVDPEPAGFLVGRTEGQGIAFGMGEKGGVKIAAQPPLTAKVHPRLKMPGLQFVPVGPCSIFKYGVAGVKIQLFVPGQSFRTSSISSISSFGFLARPG